MQEKVLFEKSECYIYEFVAKSFEKVTQVFGGRLQIVNNEHGTFIRFLPYGLESNTREDWTYLVNGSVSSYSKENQSIESVQVDVEADKKRKYKMEINLNDLKYVRRNYQGHSYEIPSVVFIRADGREWPNVFFHQGGSKQFLLKLKEYYVFEKSEDDSSLWRVRPNNQRPRDDESNSTVSVNQSNFKIKNILKGALHKLESNRPTSEPVVNDLLSECAKSIYTESNIQTSLNEGYEMLTKINLGKIPAVVRLAPVTKSSIKYDAQGCLIGRDQLKEAIFRGGLEDNQLRRELWPYLLGYYEWNSTPLMRDQKRQQRTKDYLNMKLQWSSLSSEQLRRFKLINDRHFLIDSDVVRTDRNNPLFAQDDSPYLQAIEEILKTYVMFNFDLGYEQGMNEILAPILAVMQDKVDTFWTFAGWMKNIESCFWTSNNKGTGSEKFILKLEQQLQAIKMIVEFIDPVFSDYLDKAQLSRLDFCLEWILFQLKRQFTYSDTFKLWEILWTELPCRNFFLLVCVSILLMNKFHLMANMFTHEEIIKYFNKLPMHIDLDKTLIFAEGLYIQMRNFNNLPDEIAKMFDLSKSSTVNKIS